MTLRCKPGDLAVVVKTRIPSRWGLVVHVLGPALDRPPGWWVVDCKSIPAPNSAGWRAPDANLRPIGTPDDDAKDETLSWKPLPLPEIIPAMLDREVEHG